jgi:hypothetical protein
MKYRSTLIFLIFLLPNLNCFSQVIHSEKSTIFVDTKEEELIIDSIPPTISIIYPIIKEGEAFNVKESEITIMGQVVDVSGIKTLFINAEPKTIAENNLFASEMVLKEGKNKISVIAMDNWGNYSEAKYIINYSPEVIFRTLNGKGAYYTLLIGVDEYSDPAIQNLDNPIRDATALYEILVSKYTFLQENMKLLKNARMEDIIHALDELSNKITSDDNLLIFYAGHGWWDERANIGYWLPSDAQQVSKAAWFRNSTLCDYLKEINSKHTLLIADACFGGSIFKTRTAFLDASKAINMLYELPSRKAMTSGTLTKVPDRSSFVKYLLERLNENTEKYLTSEQLFSSFRMAVINNSDVVPQYGEIYNVGDQGGDFIFIRK